VLHRNTALRGRPSSSVGFVGSHLPLVRLRTVKGRGGSNMRHATVASAEQEGAVAGHQRLRRRRSSWLSRAERGLTPRSRRGPTASHQAREAVGHIIGLAGLVQRRWSRLNSNVRRRSPPATLPSTAVRKNSVALTCRSRTLRGRSDIVCRPVYRSSNPRGSPWTRRNLI